MQATIDIPTRTDWAAYEEAKAELKELDPNEYERKIKQSTL